MLNCFVSESVGKDSVRANNLSRLREISDVYYNINKPKGSDEDMEANIYGRKIGRENKDKDCHEMVKERYRP